MSGFLIACVDTKIAKANDPTKKVNWACKQFAKDPKWKEFLGEELADPAEALRVQYFAAKKNKDAKKHADMLMDMIASSSGAAAAKGTK